MSRLLAIAGLVLAFAVTLAFAQTKPGTKEATNRSEDEAAIRQLADQYAAGWNAGDAKKAADIFTNSAIFVGDDGHVDKGRAAIEKSLAQSLSGPMKGTSFKLTVDGIGFVRPDLAIGYGTSQVQSAPGNPSKGHYVVTCTKTSAGWKVVAVGTGEDVKHQ